MDSKQLTEAIVKISDYLDNMVEEGITVVRYQDESMDEEGVKIGTSLILHEIDGDLILERIVEFPNLGDPADVAYEELGIASTVEELLPTIKAALEESQEESDALAWLDYENEIEDEEDEEDDQ